LNILIFLLLCSRTGKLKSPSYRTGTNILIFFRKYIMFPNGRKGSLMTDNNSILKKLNKVNAVARQAARLKPSSGVRAAINAPNFPGSKISAALRSALETQKHMDHLSGLVKNLPKAEFQDTVNAAIRPSKAIQAALDSMRDTVGVLPPAERLPQRREFAKPQITQTQIRDVSDLGAAIRRTRKAKRLTQQNFADLAGVGRRFLSELEQGKQTLEIGKVLKVAAAARIQLIMASSETDE
jgi:y4mF family transcriptional regulator